METRTVTQGFEHCFYQRMQAQEFAAWNIRLGQGYLITRFTKPASRKQVKSDWLAERVSVQRRLKRNSEVLKIKTG
jgi:hypothetical protein